MGLTLRGTESRGEGRLAVLAQRAAARRDDILDARTVVELANQVLGAGHPLLVEASGIGTS